MCSDTEAYAKTSEAYTKAYAKTSEAYAKKKK